MILGESSNQGAARRSSSPNSAEDEPWWDVSMGNPPPLAIRPSLEEYFDTAEEASEERAALVANVDEFGETIVGDADPLFVESQEDDLAGCHYSSCNKIRPPVTMTMAKKRKCPQLKKYCGSKSGPRRCFMALIHLNPGDGPGPTELMGMQPALLQTECVRKGGRLHTLQYRRKAEAGRPRNPETEETRLRPMKWVAGLMMTTGTGTGTRLQSGEMMGPALIITGF
jgi:hypothetical protein